MKVCDKCMALLKPNDPSAAVIEQLNNSTSNVTNGVNMNALLINNIASTTQQQQQQQMPPMLSPRSAIPRRASDASDATGRPVPAYRSVSTLTNTSTSPPGAMSIGGGGGAGNAMTTSGGMSTVGGNGPSSASVSMNMNAGLLPQRARPLRTANVAGSSPPTANMLPSELDLLDNEALRASPIHDDPNGGGGVGRRANFGVGIPRRRDSNIVIADMGTPIGAPPNLVGNPMLAAGYAVNAGLKRPPGVLPPKAPPRPHANNQ